MTHHFDRITQQIIDNIEEGAEAYTMPWHRLGADIGCPFNAVTTKGYRGLNVLGLGLAASAAGYPTGRWASYRQWSSIGAQVRKGEKGTPIFFWQARDNQSAAAEGASETQCRGFVARTFTVFNIAQVDGAPGDLEETLSSGAASCQTLSFLERLDFKVIHGGDRSYFEPSTDLVRLPHSKQFKDHESYFSVLAHEAVHWAGGKARLNRDLNGRFGTNAYAMEELIAELGAAFLCSAMGVSQTPREDHAAYIASWLKVMRGDNKAILTAASKAQQAVDYILTRTGMPTKDADLSSSDRALEAA